MTIDDLKELRELLEQKTGHKLRTLSVGIDMGIACPARVNPEDLGRAVAYIAAASLECHVAEIRAAGSLTVGPNRFSLTPTVLTLAARVESLDRAIEAAKAAFPDPNHYEAVRQSLEALKSHPEATPSGDKAAVEPFFVPGNGQVC